MKATKQVRVFACNSCPSFVTPCLVLVLVFSFFSLIHVLRSSPRPRDRKGGACEDGCSTAGADREHAAGPARPCGQEVSCVRVFVLWLFANNSKGKSNGLCNTHTHTHMARPCAQCTEMHQGERCLLTVLFPYHSRCACAQSLRPCTPSSCRRQSLERCCLLASPLASKPGALSHSSTRVHRVHAPQ